MTTQPVLPPHGQPGFFVVVEGISRAGKSTMIKTLAAGPKPLVRAKWNSHADVAPVTAKLSENRSLDALGLTLLFLADLRLSYTEVILPGLEAGQVVVCDRYVYTALVRGLVRGLPRSLLLELCAQFVSPDLVLHVDTDVDTVTERFTRIRHGRGWFGVGLDAYSQIDPSGDDLDAFRWWSAAQQKIYRSLADDLGWVADDHIATFDAAVRAWRGDAFSQHSIDSRR
jgi:dTMP kinase